MAIGPGKYDEEATLVMQRVKADAVVVIVAGGVKGDGFSVQATMELTLALPGVLRSLADVIEADMKTGKAFDVAYPAPAKN